MSIIKQIIGSGASGGVNWEGAWVTDTAYKKSDQVGNGGDLFLCMTAHTSAALNEPGVGANWQTVWVRTLDSLTAAQIDAAAGTSGSPSSSNKYVTSADTRLAPHDIEGVAGESLTIHKAVYLKSDGKWYLATNALSSIEADAVGFTTEAIDAEATGTIRIRAGFFTDAAWNWTPGSVLYLGTGGNLTATPPNTITKQVGFAVEATIIYFDPHEGAIDAMFVINGNQLEIDYTPTSFTPVNEAGVTTATNQLTALIKGIDEKLAELAGA